MKKKERKTLTDKTKSPSTCQIIKKIKEKYKRKKIGEKNKNKEK